MQLLGGVQNGQVTGDRIVPARGHDEDGRARELIDQRAHVVDLARDVDVVRSRGDTRANDRLAQGRERAGAGDHNGRLREGADEAGRRVDVDRLGVHVHIGRLERGAQVLRAPAEHDQLPVGARRPQPLDDQPPGVPGRAQHADRKRPRAIHTRHHARSARLKSGPATLVARTTPTTASSTKTIDAFIALGTRWTDSPTIAVSRFDLVVVRDTWPGQGVPGAPRPGTRRTRGERRHGREARQTPVWR